VLEREACEGGRDARRERARERADPQPQAALGHQLAELAVRQVQAVVDDVGVLEQQRAGLRERQPARPAIQQPGAELALERRDLLRDGRLGQRERPGRARERPVARDLAERQHPARIQHRHSLCHARKDDLH
jgi:hypothetical protein